MTLRADHVAGAAFILLGIAVFAMSGSLPFGRLSAPGAGMMPKLVTAIMMVLAGAIIASGAASQTVASIDWSDGKHAVSVVAIAAVAIALYRPLGFILTMALLVFALLVIGERRNLLRAAAYSVALTLFAYFLFGTALKAPLERGVFWL
jgi:hypothetical protein